MSQKVGDPKKTSFLDKTRKVLLDPGFLFTLGNAFLLPSPLTIGASFLIFSMVSLGQTAEPKNKKSLLSKLKKLSSTPNLGLMIAGAALIPIAISSFMAVPWATVSGAALLTNTAFLSGIASSFFVAFDFMKPMEGRGIIKPFRNTSLLKRSANVLLKSETYSAIGMMAVSSMAGPVGFLMWPVIGVSSALTVMNSQKEAYSNMGAPKLWMAGACAMNAVAAFIANPAIAIANISYTAAYTSLEVMEPNNIAQKIKTAFSSSQQKTSVPLQEKSLSPEFQPAPILRGTPKQTSIKGRFAQRVRPAISHHTPAKQSVPKKPKVT